MKLLDALRSLFSLGTPRLKIPDPQTNRPVWDLRVGTRLLGQLDWVGFETPWITATFSPTSEFQKWMPLITWQARVDAALDEEDDALEPSAEVAWLLHEAHAAGGLVAVERGDAAAPERRLFHFDDDFKVSVRPSHLESRPSP